ncbi:hypothetical protein [Mucilaginibacter flavidus]|uniref:hypothetical protein n=1 Tax=Mucilaginibacter flavidus TaxID=2949309 RepID=UPI0020921B00|nr:hypothetical protein [Mucilaginibacter flavidus]MCO5950324.1 hypothetical protein [Mucilaginibacter flavidus]
MKVTVKVVAAALLSLVFFYVACKKSGDAPIKTASTKDVAGLVGVDFAKAVAGNYGGVSLNDGIKAPEILNSSTKKILNSPNSLCGLTIDTTVKYTYNQGGTKSVISGRFVFTFTCSSTIPDGYKVFTNILNAGKTPQYAFIYTVVQAYKVQALNAQYSKVSLDGTLRSFGDFKYGNQPFVDTTFLANSIYQHQNYVMHNLVIDVANNLDVISGTATFTSKGRNAFGKWEYIGTIEYKGNHKAIITINGQAYDVDLITGVVTPI